MKTIAFFNNKGGVGKTSLVYHLAWMYAELGLRVVAADLDPQANLTTMFLDEDSLETLWTARGERTVMTPIRPLLEGKDGIAEPVYEDVGAIALLAGDLSLSAFEEELSRQWSLCLEGKESAFRVIAAFHEVLSRCAQTHGAELALIDLAPNLGAINRAALIAADHVIVPLDTNLISLKGLQNLGLRMQEWRNGWRKRLERRPSGLDLPSGSMTPEGYVVSQIAIRLDRPVQAKAHWMSRISDTYREAILGSPGNSAAGTDSDPHCLGTLKPYRSLMALAQEARKPMFLLRAADGAIGGHAYAVQDCYHDFQALAREIARRTGVSLP